MKKIAFLSFDWDFRIVSEYYLGLQDVVKDRRDIQVVIYNAYGMYYVSLLPKENTFEVFSLFDPNDYDAVIIQGNRTWPPERRQKIVDKVVACGKPVVSINYDLSGAHSIGTNNYQEEYELVLRVLKDSGCQHPAFVNGLRTSVEAQDRARGYRDACEELGIEDARFFQANWQKEAGIVTAKKMLRKPDDLPDVVFCCNDDLAVGVQETLQQAGVRVPEDVRVTGFDNRDISDRAQPRITTIDRDYATIARTSLDMLEKLMAGEDVPQKVYSPAKHILADSCGYPARSDAERLNDFRDSGNASERFFEVLGNFQFTVLSAKSIYAILENCEQFAQELDCPNVYLTLQDSFLHSDPLLGATAADSVSHLVARKGRVAGMSCDREHVYASYTGNRILPSELTFGGSLYMVSSLRHSEGCIGTIVTEGVPTAVRYGFAAYFLTVLSNALVAAKKSELLAELRQRLNG